MKKFTLFLQKHYQILYNLFLFVVATFLMLYILPDQSRFKYDFEPGQAWMHENLEAPFSFPIYKTREEIRSEKEQWKQSHPIYLEHSKSTLESAKSNWIDLIERSSIDSSVSRIQLQKIGNAFLDKIYSDGVFSPPAISNIRERIWYLSNRGVFRIVDPDEFVTPFQASELIKDCSDSISNSKTQLWVIENLPDFVKPNISFAAELTENRNEQYLNSISSTTGLISEGEMIVFQGQIIDKNVESRLYSYRKTLEGSADPVSSWQVRGGHFLLIGIVLTMLYLFLEQFRPQILENSNSLTLILTTLVGLVIIGNFTVSINASYLYIIPFPIVPIILRSFYDTRLALFVHFMVILVMGLVAPNSFEFIFLQFMAGVFSVVTVTGLYKRSQLFLASAKITGVYIVSYFAFTLIRGDVTETEHLTQYGYFALNGIMSIVAYPLIYLFEKVFGQVSDVTLLELGDTNTPLLRELRLKAPGTFQHSLQVGNLAESVIDEIGGNTLLVRTGALYHDIGKMLNPLYFVENQTTGINPHNDLDPKESAGVIIDHVKEGIVLAKSKRLPDTVIDFIRTHHGTTKVGYFFRQYQNDREGELTQDEIDAFTYPGPKPFSKETAVLMMADTVEAATRSLVRPTAEDIHQMVDKLIDHQQNEKQFDNANITLGEISQARHILKKKLMSIHHLRVEYPD